MKIPSLDEFQMASCGFWWRWRHFDAQRCCTVKDSLFSYLDGVEVNTEEKNKRLVCLGLFFSFSSS